MQLTYRLKRICGSVYTNGNAIFTPDGNSVISPVGNRVTAFDLIHHSTTTSPHENRKTIKNLAISNNGIFLLVIDVEGHGFLLNYTRMIVLARMHFKRKVYDVKFSPDDKYFVITHNNGCQIWKTPGINREFCPLVLARTFGGHYDEVVCVDWSHDSRCIIMGSKDMHAQVYANVNSQYMACTLLSGHRDPLIGTYFGRDSRDAYTISHQGAVFTWKYSKHPPTEEPSSEFKEGSAPAAIDDQNDDEKQEEEEEHDGVNDKDSESDPEPEEPEEDNAEDLPKVKRQKMTKPRNPDTVVRKKAGSWKLEERKFLWEDHADITSVAYNRQTGLLVLGYNRGMFALYELPGCVNIHRLSVSTGSINTASINSTGEWLLLGSSSLGQICVWEWKSESFILKQQGHLRGLNVLEYSRDGQFIATGGEDGKVKLWSTSSGFCFITFSDHIAPVTGVKFIGQGASKAVLSSSLDGSVRAYDLVRYQNFKTYTSPTLVQFTSLAVDSSGEIVCAGSLDPFNIYVWSVQTAQLLDVLSGHEGPIACLEMSTTVGTSILASGSWDGTMKLWNIYENKNIETMEHGCDVLGLAFRPDGKELCTCTTNGNINFWDVESGEQVGFIEGRLDLAGGRLTTDAMTVQNSAKRKCFTSVTYSADGMFVLAGGRSKYACIYAVATRILVKKFQLSHNSDRLVDGVSLDNLDEPQPEEGFSRRPKKDKNAFEYSSSSLVIQDSSRLTDGSRTIREEIMSSCIRFSPTGREWAVATTQGLQIFGLDDTMAFLPTDLDLTITPQSIDAAIARSEFGLAINMALQLNERQYMKKALDMVPFDSINLVVKSINQAMIQRLLKLIAEEIMKSRHLEFYLSWSWEILQAHGPVIQKDSMACLESIRSLIRAMTAHENEILRLCDDNQFTLSHITMQQKKNAELQKELETPTESAEME